MRKVTGWMLVAVAGCALVSLPAAAQLYQWKNANGTMEYSNNPPPPNIPAGNIIKTPKSRPGSAPAAAAAPAATGEPAKLDAKAADKSSGPKSIAEREAEYKKRQAEMAEKSAKDEKAAHDEQARQQRCRELRASVAQLESGQRVRVPNEKGEVSYLDDSERARRVEQSRKELSTAKCD